MQLSYSFKACFEKATNFFVLDRTLVVSCWVNLHRTIRVVSDFHATVLSTLYNVITVGPDHSFKFDGKCLYRKFALL